MSCGCSSVHTPPTITSCNATYNVCTGKSFYINVIGCADPIVTIPTQSDIGYPIVGLLEYSEINKKIYYTHNGSNSGVATTDSFTYTVVCNGISRTCTITVNIDDSISIDTTVVELDGCCIPTYTAKVYGNTVYSVIVDNTNILNTSYTSDTALSTFLNTYINVNGTFTVTKTTVSDVVNWTIVLTSNTKVLNSVTGISLVQAIKTLCGCKLGDVEYTWTIPDCATLVTGYSIHDCKIQVIVPLYDALDDACCPIELTVRCGNCTSNCEKTEVYNWCPPIYENCQTPDCSLYPCTTYNPISGNCDDICDECDTCCQNESGYYCAECCDNNGCALANCPETSQPICVGQECVCYVNGIEVEPLPNGCCPNCTELTVLPNCHTCVNGIIVAPDTTCPSNTTYNYTTCQCDCDCINGYCYNVLTQTCEPCPECVTIAGLYTCNGVPYESTLADCTQCINNVITPNTCADGSIPNPYFNPNLPSSTTGTNPNPCCISLTPCDCDNPTCPGQGTVCTHIEGSEECYCVDCTSLSFTNKSVVFEEVNGCDCVGNTCVSGCPTCTGTVSIKEYCTPFFVKFEGCLNNTHYRFKVYELTNLLEKPVLGCDYQSYLDEYNNNNVNLTDITASIVTSTEYNITSSIFFNPATLGSGNYIAIPKENVQTLLIKVVKYGIETIYEFVLDGKTCLLASEDNSDIDLIIPDNPRIFRETCKFIYSLKSTGICPFTDYEWTFPNTTGEDETAQEIQDGKYIVIFPPDFPLGTTRQVCASAEYVYDEVVCYVKEACKDYTPCTGGCGCDPCTDPNSSFITSIETITDALNGVINASASVLLNCNGTLGGTLATCEPAESNENCSPGNGLVEPNNNGTSPLPFSLYPNYDANNNNYSPCGLWECTEDEPTGCEQDNQAPCGWMYDDTKLEVLSYNGANIEVGFINGAITGKLCWGARYECGYVCSCKEINKTLGCEDFGIDSISINCPPSQPTTNAGVLVINVNNNGANYKLEIFKNNTIISSLTINSTNLSQHNINLPLGVVNGDVIKVKITMLVDGLDCEYEDTIDYTCCNINMTASPIIACLDTDGSSILIANTYTSTCSNGTITATSPPGWSVSDTSPYYINYPANTNAGSYDVSLDWTCGACTGRTTMLVSLNKPTVTPVNIKNICASTTNPTTVSLYDGLNVTPLSSVSNTVFQTGINVVCNSDGTISGSTNISNPDTWTTPTFGDTTIYYQYTDIAGCKSCGSFIVTIEDCCNNNVTVEDITTCLVPGGGTVPINSAFAPLCASGSITSVILPSGWAYASNILTYDGTVTAGTHSFTATGTCGNCTSTATFTVSLDAITSENISNDCTSLTNPTSVNLNDALTITGDGIVIFKTGTTCNATTGLLDTIGSIITDSTTWDTIGTTTIYYQYINTLGCNKCGSFEVVINDCCTLTLGTPTQLCSGAGELLSVTFPFSGAAYPVIISGTTTYDHNGDGTGDFILNPVANGVVTIADNTITEFVVPYPAVPNLGSNCITANLTFTDDNGCVETMTTTCTPCSPTVSFKCKSGTCVDPGDGTGEYATADLCKSAGCCGVAMNIDNIITCIDSNGATIPLSNSPTLSCVSAGVINSITSSPPGFSYLSATNSISYIAGTSPGVYTLTADWTCGTCTGEDIFTVTINTTLITVSDITNDCNAQSPLSVNLYSAIQGGNNTNTIFKVADLVGNPVCDSSGSLSGGVLLTDVESTNWATAGIVYYEYTDNNTGCNKCGSFVVTINDCCNTSMTINDVSGCLSDGSVDITATFTPDCTVNGGITDLIEPINPSNVWGITGTHPNYTISYPSNVIQGAHRLEATWECGTCTGTELFFVNINPNPTVTVPSSYTGICPFDLNSLLSNITPLGGTTIFKTGSTCTNNGTLSGGTDVLTPNNYNTNISNQAIQYQYTINGCSVCGEFTVTCCSANAGDNTNQTYCY